MARTEALDGRARSDDRSGFGPTAGVVGVVLGALGILGAVWAYWMIVPGVVFGLAAVVLGVRARRRAARETGGVAVVLGVVALLLVPSVPAVVDDAEDWGRHCALNPSNPDC